MTENTFKIPESVTTAFDSMDGVYSVIKDRNSVFLWVNQNFASLLDLRPEDLIGEEDDQKAHVAHDKLVMRIGRPLLNLHETILIPDGKSGTKAVEIVTQKGLLRDENGKISGITVNFSLRHPKRQADYWIKHLPLKPEPIELGGYIGLATDSEETVALSALPDRFGPEGTGNISRRFHSENYYLLEQNTVSGLHMLNQDETWFYNYGNAITIHIFSEINNSYERRTVGKSLELDQNPQAKVPHNTWFGVEVNEGEYGLNLSSCSLAPGFHKKDTFLPSAEKIKDLKERFPSQADLITRLATVIK